MNDYLDESALAISVEISRARRKTKPSFKLTPFETYIAVIKAFCGTMIMFIPKAFYNGGYLVSPILLLCSLTLTTICMLKLVKVGLKYKCYSYSLLVHKILGPNGKIFLDILIVTT